MTRGSMTPGRPAADQLARVEALLHQHPLVDGHNDLPWAARKHAAYDWDVLDIAGSTEGTTSRGFACIARLCVHRAASEPGAMDTTPRKMLPEGLADAEDVARGVAA